MFQFTFAKVFKSIPRVAKCSHVHNVILTRVNHLWHRLQVMTKQLKTTCDFHNLTELHDPRSL